VFEFLKPLYVIRDVELIRQISIKDFDNFVNHRSVIDESADSLFGKNLFILRDQKWRNMRSTLSPAFTGSKMRHMFNLIASISNDYMNELTKTIKTEKELEFKDFMNKYCHDVIAKCAFGVSINSMSMNTLHCI
jgi:cytochrome P450 family 9